MDIHEPRTMLPFFHSSTIYTTLCYLLSDSHDSNCCVSVVRQLVPIT